MADGTVRLARPTSQWFTTGAEYYRDEFGVAGDAAGDLGVDRAAQRQRGRPDKALQHRQAHRYYDLGALSALRGQIAAAQGPLGEFYEGVGVALYRGAQVDLDIGAGSWRG